MDQPQQASNWVQFGENAGESDDDDGKSDFFIALYSGDEVCECIWNQTNLVI